jgi:diacylglycerol kinase family enzyme
MAGAGWDSRAIELVSWKLKKQLGSLAYLAAGLQAWRGPLARIRVCADGNTCCEGQLVLLGNGRLYGGDWHFFPLADMRDGLLEVTVFPQLNLAGVARGYVGLFLRRLYSIGGAKHFRVQSVELNSAAPVPFHLEGDNVGMLPARFSIESGLLRVIVP